LSPFNNGRVIVQWGNAIATKYLTQSVPNAGLVTITLPPLGDECRGACGLAGSLVFGAT
jgi:hypothetical protein